MDFLMHTERRIFPMIMLKNDEEIDGIRTSGHYLAEMFEEIGPQICAGMSTYDVDKLFHEWMKKRHFGAPCVGYMGYPAATCVSVNDMVIHGIPSKHLVLNEGDIISVDICVTLDGFVSDSTRTYEVGKVSPEVHKLNVVTRECLYRGIDAARKRNARISDIASAVFKHAFSENGYGVVRDYTGHGVGFDLHEEPEVPNYVSPLIPNPRLKPGMVLAVEPMINMGTWKIRTMKDGWTVKTADGRPACHWEHTIAITDDGVEVLTEL